MTSIPEFLVCPCCKGPLMASHETKQTDETEQAPDMELICPRCSLAFSVREGIPMMVPHEARALSEEEALAWKLKAEGNRPQVR